jgi:hypothetical protein
MVEAKIQPLTVAQAQSVLSRAARNVGRVYGVGLSVGQQGNELIFVDDLGDPAVDGFANDGDPAIVCATQQEIEDGSFLRLFAARSLYAALALKVMEIVETEPLKP